MGTAKASGTASGAITVRGLTGELKARLRIRAAHNARSMEAEARAILEAALRAPGEDTADLATFVRGLFAPIGGVVLELPPRTPARTPPDFGEAVVVEPEPRTAPEGRPSGRARSPTREQPMRPAPAGPRGKGRKA